MEHKFKVGDEVLTSKFEQGKNNFMFSRAMNDYIGVRGVIKQIDFTDGACLVHSYWWPASALTLVTKEEEFKQGDLVEVSINNKNWLEGNYVGKTKDGLFVIEFEGKVSSWIYCCRPQPKMHKWNVWKYQSGQIDLLKGEINPINGTIVHSFEIPE